MEQVINVCAQVVSRSTRRAYAAAMILQSVVGRVLVVLAS